VNKNFENIDWVKKVVSNRCDWVRKGCSNRCKVKRVELEKGVFLCENFATIATNALPAENFKNA